VPKKKAEKFLKEDHTDSNMLVAIRIRPLNQKEIQNNEIDIIRSEDKLLVRREIYPIIHSIDCAGQGRVGVRERGQEARSAAQIQGTKVLLRSDIPSRKSH